MDNFRLWIEEKSKRNIVFLDMDETLVHHMQFHWLDAKKIDKTPYNLHPKIVKYDKDKKEFIFPRPDVNIFLDKIKDFAEIYILSHNTIDYLKGVIKKLKWEHYFRGIYSTRELDFSELNKKLDLESSSWVLVDNLPVDSPEVSNKMRILGVNVDKNFITKTKNHFVKVTDWIPSIIRQDDKNLLSAVKEIKQKLNY